MVKVVVRKLNQRPHKGSASSLTEKKVTGADGRTMKFHSLDADSRSFGSDLLQVFERNVARHRRDNKTIGGKKA